MASDGADNNFDGPSVDRHHGLCGNLCAPCSTFGAFLQGFQRHTNRLRMCGESEQNAHWPHIFGTSPWFDEKSPGLLIVRATLALIFFAHIILSMALHFHEGHWFGKLTHWSLSVEFAYLCSVSYTTHAARLQLKCQTGPVQNRASRLPHFVTATWALQHIAMPAGLLVMVLYWTLEKKFWNMGDPPGYVGVFTHGINFGLLLIDLFMGRNVFYLKHTIWFFLYIACYAIWTLIHFAARIGDHDGCKDYEDKKECPLYKVLDWRKPTATMILLSIILFCVVPLCQYPIWWCVYKRRVADIYTNQEASVEANIIGAGA